MAHIVVHILKVLFTIIKSLINSKIESLNHVTYEIKQSMLSKKILCSVIEKEKENYLSFVEKKNFLYFSFPFSEK